MAMTLTRAKARERAREKGKIERMIEVTKLFPSLVFDEIVFEDTNFGLWFLILSEFIRPWTGLGTVLNADIILA